MTQIDKSALVSYSPSQMFALVADVERYPEFLPWCADSQILKQDHNTTEASLTLAVAGIRHSFSTRNQYDPPHHIVIQLLKGPFSQLQGQWTFTALGEDACKIALSMHFEFSNPLLRHTLGPLFAEINRRLIAAFIQRAEVVYGN